ncbi:MAG TPA: ABC transporter ATP-binding protein [Jiangellaceae bacterium]|nr:ABC transporter ATP-binding protein [Jiangellaceae bacterium]
MTGSPVIDIRALTKRFGSLTAVDSLDLQVAPGEIYGLLGPNGAGKTTTIRTLLGFLNPSGGTVRLLGSNPRHTSVRRRVGYVGGDVVLDRGLKAHDLLNWYADLRGGVDSAKIDSLCEQLALDPTRKIGELSTGNRQKVAIVQSVMHEPDVLVLDEPTSGLDPLLQRSVLDLIRTRRDAGTAVLYSSHFLPEVENLADRVGILRRGVLVREDTMANLRDIARQRLELRFARDVPADLLAGIDGVSNVEIVDRTAYVLVDGSVAELVKRVAEYDVDRIVSHDEDLEDVFFRYYQDGEDG